MLCAVTEEPDIAVSSITIIAGKQLNHLDQATPHSNGWPDAHGWTDISVCVDDCPSGFTCKHHLCVRNKPGDLGCEWMVYTDLNSRNGAALDEPPSPLAGLAGVSFVALYGVARLGVLKSN